MLLEKLCPLVKWQPGKGAQSPGDKKMSEVNFSGLGNDEAAFGGALAIIFRHTASQLSQLLRSYARIAGNYASRERLPRRPGIYSDAQVAGWQKNASLIKSIPPTLRYKPGLIVADKDFVIVHGRYSGSGLPANWIVADIVRIKDGILVEHWDVVQDEVRLKLLSISNHP